jgi:hypothetical protein
MAERSRRGLHWGTWIVVLVVSNLLAWRQAMPLVSGWPLVDYGDPLGGPPSFSMFNARTFAVNLAVTVLIVCGTGFAVERFFRQRGYARFRLRTLLAVTTVIAGLFGFWRWEQSTVDEGGWYFILGIEVNGVTRPHAPDFGYRGIDTADEFRLVDLGSVTYSPLLDGTYPWPVVAGVMFGLAATMYTALWLAACAGQAAVRVRAKPQ